MDNLVKSDRLDKSYKVDTMDVLIAWRFGVAFTGRVVDDNQCCNRHGSHPPILIREDISQ